MYIDTTATVLPQVKEEDTDFEDLARMCKALGHPARIAILNHLLDQERCVCGRIVEVMPLAQSTVSQHLKVLREAGLVQGEVEGLKTCYCVNRQNLSKLLKTMAHVFNQKNSR